MGERREVFINGNKLPDGYFLNKWFESRFNANKNVLLLIVGSTGSGKSWSCLRICEDWYKYKFGDEVKFPAENIMFNLSDCARAIRDGKIKSNEFVIVEEAGVTMNSLDFQSKVNRLFNNILQSARCKNTGFIFNLPAFSLMNKTARILAHAVFETVNIDGNQVILKPKGLQTNSMTGKTYTKYLRQKVNGKLVTARRMKVGKPSSELTIPYEKKKQEFVDEQIIKVADLDKPKEDKNSKKKGDEENVPNIWKAIKLLHERGVEKQNDIAKALGISQPKVNAHIQKMERKGYFYRDFLEKALLYTSNPISTPMST